MEHTRLTSLPVAKTNSFWKYFQNNFDLYLLLIPGLLFILVYRYIPLYGISIAFKDFNIFTGITDSPWVGMANFNRVFSNPEFYQVLYNTFIISFYKLLFLFPLPIILAILLNEIGSMIFKRSLQTIVYLPHFLSWVVVSGLFISILGGDGIVNHIIQYCGGKPILFFMDQSVFRSVLVVTEGWKEVGWSAIIYLAAITSIDPQLYEAAVVDGAGKFRQMVHITIPGISTTIILLFILKLGHILEAGFEQILVMYNPTVYKVADVISTYVYRIGLGQMDFSFGTAVGLFNSLVGFILIISANTICKKTIGKSIW